jgi:iron complex transport system permease protein
MVMIGTIKQHAKTSALRAFLSGEAAGGVLLMAADLLARALIAPQELPVGVLTAVLGGGYLLWLMHRQSAALAGDAP